MGSHVDAEGRRSLTKEERDQENRKNGKLAEELFVNYLNSQEIQFIRIDQNKESFSKVFYRRCISRPDYIIYTKNGVFYIDVKFRTKETFGEGDKAEKRFYIKQKEINKLFRFQKDLNTIVWVAFTDDLMNPNFNYVPISEIYKYSRYILSKMQIYKPDIYKEISWVCPICIPEMLLFNYFPFNDDDFYKKRGLHFSEYDIQSHVSKAIDWIYKKSFAK